jgi:hypothetical protein
VERCDALRSLEPRDVAQRRLHRGHVAARLSADRLLAPSRTSAQRPDEHERRLRAAACAYAHEERFLRRAGLDPLSGDRRPEPPTADSTRPLIASERTASLAWGDARMQQRWSTPPNGLAGFVRRTVTFCTCAPNRPTASSTRRTALACCACEKPGLAPDTSILKALALTWACDSQSKYG